jgi:hypothetical protein
MSVTMCMSVHVTYVTVWHAKKLRGLVCLEPLVALLFGLQPSRLNDRLPFNDLGLDLIGEF